MPDFNVVALHLDIDLVSHHKQGEGVRYILIIIIKSF